MIKRPIVESIRRFDNQLNCYIKNVYIVLVAIFTALREVFLSFEHFID